MSEAVDIFSQQAANRRRSQWVVAAFVGFFAWLGFGGDYIAWLYTQGAPPGEYRHVFPFLGILLTIVGMGMAAWGWKTAPRRILAAAGAREIVEPVTDEERVLVNCVDEMTIAAGLPRPRVWIVADEDPNAFATGHDERDAHVTVTSGLLTACTRDELQAVVAHELGHLKNRDVQLMTLLAGLVGAVAIVAEVTGRMLRGGVRVGGSGRRADDRDRGNAGPLAAVLVVVWLVSWLLAPLVTRLLATSVSRNREYLADTMSAQFTRNPTALASALEKIGDAHAPTRTVQQSFAHLCIADPLGRAVNSRQGWLADLFATHPPMPLRVARLRAMGYQALKKSGSYVPPGIPA